MANQCSLKSDSQHTTQGWGKYLLSSGVNLYDPDTVGLLLCCPSSSSISILSKGKSRNKYHTVTYSPPIQAVYSCFPLRYVFSLFPLEADFSLSSHSLCSAAGEHLNWLNEVRPSAQTRGILLSQSVYKQPQLNACTPESTLGIISPSYWLL